VLKEGKIVSARPLLSSTGGGAKPFHSLGGKGDMGRKKKRPFGISRRGALEERQRMGLKRKCTPSPGMVEEKGVKSFKWKMRGKKSSVFGGRVCGGGEV